MNDILPTAKRLQTFDNKHDGRCFECHQLWEDTNHVLCCPSEERDQARNHAFIVLRKHFEKQFTPTVMTDLICASMNSWLNRNRIEPPHWHHTDETITTAITLAFQSQKRIGWDQFFRGRLSVDWLQPIAIYYNERRPGHKFNPERWM